MMSGFALGIRYLTGYAVATDPASREQAEWPPHPGRVFMALAAAHFETGEAPEERQVLEWLEALDPPMLTASGADHRSVVTCYVPVNADKVGDIKDSTTSLQSAPALTRHRVGRTFPRVRLHDDCAYLIWDDVVVPPEHRSVLDGLCQKVTYVGHSSSLVQMWCTDRLDGLEPSLVPDDIGLELSMRHVTKGTLDYLRRQYNAASIENFARLSLAINSSTGKAQREAKAEFERAMGQKWKKSLTPPATRRPVLSLWQGYRRVSERTDVPPDVSVFDPGLVIVRLQRRASRFERLDLVSTLQVTEALRRSVQSVIVQDLGVDSIPSVVTGHQPDGSPMDTPHAAYVPLAFVGRPHAAGNLMGLAIALPREVHWPDGRAQRRIVMTAIARITELALGRLGIWNLVPEVRETPPYTLLPDTWTALPGGARVWASVTPVSFDEHSKEKERGAYMEAVAAMVRKACTRIALPEPVAVYVTPVSKHVGAPAAREFPRLRRKDGGERRHMHVVLEFPKAVLGPVLLGAGRYRGYGVCRPVREFGGS